MPRIQILELPDVERPDGTDETPFILIVDQVTEAEAEEVANDASRQRLAQESGARTVAVFRQTIDLPANLVPVDEDGNYAGPTVRIPVQADLDGFRAQVEQALDDARRRINAVHIQAD